MKIDIGNDEEIIGDLDDENGDTVIVDKAKQMELDRIRIQSRFEGQRRRNKSKKGMNEIQDWLKSLHLSQDYIEDFVSHGYDSMDKIKRIEHEYQLKEIGIVKEQDIDMLIMVLRGFDEEETTQ